MRKRLPVLIILFFIPVLSLAQESTGFSDPDNIQPLLDYRLPEWGYTNLFWDFSLNGNLINRQSDEEQNSDTNHQLSGQLSPNYTRYYESEARISTYSLRPDIDYSFRDRNSFSNDEQYDSDLELRLFWNFNEKLYLNNSDFFFTSSFSGFFRQTRIRNEEISQATADIDQTILNRSFNPNFFIGIGYGRLRSVNPMIRSLRMNERLNALNTGQSLNNQDILEAAGHFTRLNGYQQAHDRPQKYFWGDMDNLLSADFTALDAFDLLYLTDVTQETLGPRREGWEISATASLQYSVNYNHEKDGITGGSTRQTSKSTLLVPTISGSWYKNLSLKHQIGLTGSFQYFKELNGEEFQLNESKIINPSANWLYTITDRVLTNTTIAYSRIGRESYTSNVFSISSDINYFLEDRFSLFTNLRFVYRPNSGLTFLNGTITNTIDETNFIFDVGLRYYMKRGLF